MEIITHKTLSKTYCAALSGVDAILVTVETTLAQGIGMCIVGLPDAAVKESSERVKSAINESGYKFPNTEIVINMSPADVKKEGSAYDLPIAIGILASYEKIPITKLGDYMLMGELSLDGTVQPVKGSYKGMYTHRTYLMEILTDKKPAKVLVNGTATTHFTYGTDKVLRVTLPQANVHKAATVSLQ